MKNITKTGIVLIVVLCTHNAVAITRTQCMGEVSSEYTELVSSYKSTGTCHVLGGRLVALETKICECVTSGKTSAYSCPAAHELCCGGDIEYDVSNTVNHVQTAKKHTWNATTQVCSTSTIYRCETGYYGNPTDTSSSACNKCPPWGGVYQDSGRTTMLWGTTETPGETAITGCVVPAGTYFDSGGEFTLVGVCLYKK